MKSLAALVEQLLENRPLIPMSGFASVRHEHKESGEEKKKRFKWASKLQRHESRHRCGTTVDV